ncbi:sigma-54-dependent transcriptional regulator [Geomonas ferrireducens]|uniref:sigma-54-dependent transcriptional regulator n=1 Tax=Geomonas ferrireducens TaxID=2570227 RepID=UPI0010A8986A|nr:sigma-54 dependent transcriptional regulator [Geomonas ferrireducens]
MSAQGKKKGVADQILLVDDEPHILFGSSVMLRQAGFARVKTLDDIRQLLPMLLEEEPGVIVLDLQMPHISGKEMLGELNCSYPAIPVIIVTAANELETAIDCMKLGAFDYIVKPVDATRFVTSVRKALDRNAMQREIESLRESLLGGAPANDKAFSAIKTRSPRMKAIFSYLEAVAPTEQPVLITGETGVGKELIARALHELSGRRGAFVPVNSAGVDDHVFSDTLFGHRKGAFTGADQARDGMIVRSAGGTLFLDEIGETSPATQVKLLRLLQEGEYYPLGSDHPAANQARVVVATNRDLPAAIAEGSFRRDLYYRLCAHQVNVPPLRERTEDIPLLLETFVEEAARTLHREAPGYPYELASLLAGYSFPGNVRELRAMVFNAVTLQQGGRLSVAAFRDATGAGLPAVAPGQEEGGQWLDLSAGFPTLAEITQSLIRAALSRSGGNQRAAAELLGITRQALNQRISRK